MRKREKNVIKIIKRKYIYTTVRIKKNLRVNGLMEFKLVLFKGQLYFETRIFTFLANFLLAWAFDDCMF